MPLQHRTRHGIVAATPAADPRAAASQQRRLPGRMATSPGQRYTRFCRSISRLIWLSVIVLGR